MVYVKKPIETIPFNFENKVGGVKLPIKLPFIFKEYSSGVTLPLTLPFSFQNMDDKRKSFKIPNKITCEYANEQKQFKLPITEFAHTTVIKIPTNEVAWILQGLIIEENVVSVMKKPLVLLEDIRSRILIDAQLINKNNIKISWYGDKVPQLEIYKKIFVDEEWTKVGVYDWNKGSTVIELDNNEYELKVLGTNSTGESAINTIGESMFVNVDTLVNVSLNEKVYSFDVDFNSIFRIEVNF